MQFVGSLGPGMVGDVADCGHTVYFWDEPEHVTTVLPLASAVNVATTAPEGFLTVNVGTVTPASPPVIGASKV